MGDFQSRSQVGDHIGQPLKIIRVIVGVNTRAYSTITAAHDDLFRNRSLADFRRIAIWNFEGHDPAATGRINGETSLNP